MNTHLKPTNVRRPLNPWFRFALALAFLAVAIALALIGRTPGNLEIKQGSPYPPAEENWTDANIKPEIVVQPGVIQPQCDGQPVCDYIKMHHTGSTAVQAIERPALPPGCDGQPICDYLEAHNVGE